MNALAEPFWNGEKLPNLGLKTHGMSQTKIYRRWKAMIHRCTRPWDHAFSDYGGRGIRVCVRWLKFENFLTDMGMPPTEGMEIDRKDNNGHYTPSNCKWATRIEQARNTRANRILTIDGQSKSCAEWAEQFGISQNLLHFRLKTMPPEVALTKPIAATNQNKNRYITFNNQHSKWVVNVRRKYLGLFSTEVEAIKARDDYERSNPA